MFLLETYRHELLIGSIHCGLRLFTGLVTLKKLRLSADLSFRGSDINHLVGWNDEKHTQSEL